MTYNTLLTGLVTQLSNVFTSEEPTIPVEKVVPYKKAGLTPIVYVYPNLYSSTPIKLRRVNKTFTFNVAVERTCRTEADYVSLWGTAETVYEMFEVLDDYITVDSVCFMVRNISARYYKDTDDIAYVVMTITLEQLSDD